MVVQTSPLITTNRRRYKRYIVEGFVTLDCALGKANGALLNLGQGGILVRVAGRYRAATIVSLRIQLENYPEMLATSGQVVGTQDGLVAIQFLEKPMGIELLLNWLEQENCTWSGFE